MIINACEMREKRPESGVRGKNKKYFSSSKKGFVLPNVNEFKLYLIW